MSKLTLHRKPTAKPVGIPFKPQYAMGHTNVVTPACHKDKVAGIHQLAQKLGIKKLTLEIVDALAREPLPYSGFALYLANQTANGMSEGSTQVAAAA